MLPIGEIGTFRDNLKSVSKYKTEKNVMLVIWIFFHIE